MYKMACLTISIKLLVSSSKLAVCYFFVHKIGSRSLDCLTNTFLLRQGGNELNCRRRVSFVLDTCEIRLVC